MKFQLPLTLLLFAAITAGCSNPKPAQPTKPAQPATPAQAAKPAPDERILFHSRAIMNLLGPHASDCTKADATVQAYLREHQQELKGLPDRYQAMIAKLPAEQKQQHQKKLKQKIGKMVNERLNTMMTLGMQCPAEAKKIHKAMDFMKHPG